MGTVSREGPSELPRERQARRIRGAGGVLGAGRASGQSACSWWADLTAGPRHTQYPFLLHRDLSALHTLTAARGGSSPRLRWVLQTQRRLNPQPEPLVSGLSAAGRPVCTLSWCASPPILSPAWRRLRLLAGPAAPAESSSKGFTSIGKGAWRRETDTPLPK